MISSGPEISHAPEIAMNPLSPVASSNQNATFLHWRDGVSGG